MGRKRKNGSAADENAPKIGHNSAVSDHDKPKLAGYVKEIERVNDEIKELSTQRGEMFKAAKDAGFDTKALRHLIKLRSWESDKRAEFENAVDAYAMALGDFVTSPLGQAMLPTQPAA